MEDIVDRLKIRADIRRNAKTRKSVQENKPDRISDLLEEAAEEILYHREFMKNAFIAHPNIDLDIQGIENAKRS